jgi:hypothetical protein
MCSPISGASAADLAQNTAAPKTPAPAPKPSQAPDTVHLSATALAALGDSDHDGDSH